MTGPSPDEGRDRFCDAKKRQGEGHCERPAGWGTSHPGYGRCKLHGGSTQTGTVAAQKAEAAAEAKKLGLTVATTPTAALSDALNRAYADVLVTGAKAASLDETGWKQHDRQGFEKPSVWVQLYWAALDRYAHLADRCTALGIEAAAVSVVQAHGQEVIELIRLVVRSLAPEAEETQVVEAVQGAVVQLRERRAS